MQQLDEKAINHEDLAAYHDQLMQSEMSKKADKGNVTAGSYNKVTVNSQGIVTAGENPTTLAGHGITDAYTKTEVDTKFDEFSGPVYDETDHGFNFPTTAKMTYDSVDHGFVFG